MGRYTGSRENDVIKEIFINNKTMAQIAREQGVEIERIRQIKEKGLRKLKSGRARRELLEKFEVAGAGILRGGLTGYKEHDFTSIVERTVIKKLDAQERYERQLREIEERHKESLSLSGKKKIPAFRSMAQGFQKDKNKKKIHVYLTMHGSNAQSFCDLSL